MLYLSNVQLGVLVGILIVGEGTVSDSFAFFGTRFFLLGFLSNLDMMICAWSYCRLLCNVCLMSLGGLLFSEGGRGGGGSGEKGREGKL